MLDIIYLVLSIFPRERRVVSSFRVPEVLYWYCAFHLLKAHHKPFTLQESIQRIFNKEKLIAKHKHFVSLSEFRNSSVGCTDNTLIPTIYLDSDTGLIAAGLAGGAGHIWPHRPHEAVAMWIFLIEYNSNLAFHYQRVSGGPGLHFVQIDTRSSKYNMTIMAEVTRIMKWYLYLHHILIFMILLLPTFNGASKD